MVSNMPIVPPLPQVAIAKAMLDAFFYGPNEFNLSDLCEQDAQKAGQVLHTGAYAFQSSVRRYLKGLSDRPLLLPFMMAGQSVIVWYACAHTDTQYEALRAELEAFIGPSFADFDPTAPEVVLANGVVASLLEKSGLRYFSFQAHRPERDVLIGKQWQLYWDLLEHRPLRSAIQTRTFAQLRSSFDRALLARNESEALSAMGALRDQHGLSAENRAFLEVRLNAAFGRWDSIVEHPQFKHLIHLKLPPETFGDVFDALFETRLRPFERTEDPTHLLEAFSSHVQFLVGPLLRSRGSSRRISVLKTVLLNELVQPEPSADLCHKLLSILGAGKFGQAENGIRTLIEALQPKSGLIQARSEMELERYEQALVLLKPLPDSIEVLTALLRCAREIEDPELARSVVNRTTSASQSISQAIRSNSSRLFTAVEKIAGPGGVDTWRGRLVVEPEDDVSVAEFVLRWREIARSSDARDALSEPGFPEDLASLSEELSIAHSHVFEVIYPIWFEWLIERTAPDSAFLVTYEALAESLRVRDRFGETELELLKNAILHIVRAGAGQEQYDRLINRLIGVFEQVSAPHTMAWALDLTDGLVNAQCRDLEARLRWLTSVVQAGISYYERLGIAERGLLRLLAKENSIDLPKDGENSELETALEQTFSRRVLLYSLDSLAISRAQILLSKIFPHAHFDINDEEVCTPRLKNAVRNADWVVFVAAVATHQAFFCIKNALRENAFLQQVEGSGTTRIVECVVTKSQGL
jgi:hypothetical protein